MRNVLVRYGEIGTKSRYVQSQMRQRLRQKIQDRLEYDSIDFEKVSSMPGRIIVETGEAKKAAEAASEVPGVVSTYPATKVDASIEEMKEASESFGYGETFGVDANRSGKHDFTSRDIEEELGAHIEDFSGASVDLDNPDTLLGVDVRSDEAYLFTERIEGVGGLPVGSQKPVLALVSGGIDSPVAAFQMMRRGSDVTLVYFYNRPIAAEDHLLRFESVLEKLERFNPGKQWEYFIVDMEDVNQELMDVGRGRMVLHRVVMFRVAEKLAEGEGLKGLVTGESLGQKSSQTVSNLELTSSQIDKPVHRPLIAWDKNDIVREAKKIGTFEEATVDSACRTISPENPATKLSEEDFQALKEGVDVGELVKTAFEVAEKRGR